MCAYGNLASKTVVNTNMSCYGADKEYIFLEPVAQQVPVSRYKFYGTKKNNRF